MIDSALPIIDAICILDTGSTDNTIDVAREIIESSKLPGKVYEDTFVDFSVSRTKSFTCAQNLLHDLGWNPECTYGLLLDADMKLVVSNVFTKKMIGAYDSYSLRQDAGTRYYNIRLIRMSLNWVCKGKTHEYWCVSDNAEASRAIVEDEDLIWIDDVGDGGCKDDKFKRDERLLLQGIEDEPELRSRYYFYLGQTYSSLHRYEDAIKYYKKRIDEGGWTEEVWFSHCMICRSYIEMSTFGDERYDSDIEYWANKSYEFYNARSDPFYLAALYFYKKGDFDKCQEYIDKGKDIPLPKREILFLDNFLYTRGYSSLQFKLYVDTRDERCVQAGIDLMDTIPDVKENILKTIIPFFRCFKSIEAIELRHPEECYNLSLYWDPQEKIYNYLENNTLTALDERFQPTQEEKRIVSVRYAYLFDKNTFVIPSQKLILRDGILSRYEGISYGLVEPVKKEFLAWFKPSLSTSYDSKSHTLFYSNIECDGKRMTVYCIYNGTFLTPFSIDDEVSSICAFTMIKENEAVIIFYKNQKFYRTNVCLA
jgi:tetratricopeptide (TPR) repeat protein